MRISIRYVDFIPSYLIVAAEIHNDVKSHENPSSERLFQMASDINSEMRIE